MIDDFINTEIDKSVRLMNKVLNFYQKIYITCDFSFLKANLLFLISFPNSQIFV